MITFKTKSGTTYEVDDGFQQARLVEASADLSLADLLRRGTWRRFDHRTDIKLGDRVAFQWSTGKTTITTRVVAITEAGL